MKKESAEESGNLQFMGFVPTENRSGFTLVEILVAVVIFAVVLTTVYTSFRAVMFHTDDIKRGTASFETARNALERMRKDLEALCITRYPVYIPPSRLSDESDKDRFRFKAKVDYTRGREMSSLRFASFEHLAFGRKDEGAVGLIHYYVDLYQEDGLALRRSDSSVFSVERSGWTDLKKGQDPVLCKDIKSFALTFKDSDGTEHDEWDSDSQAFDYETPVSVKIRITAGKEKVRKFETSVSLPVQRSKKKTGT